MNSSSIDWRAFGRAEFATFDLTDINCDRELAIKDFTQKIEKSWHSLNQLEVKQERCKRFQVAGAKYSDYSEFFIELGKSQFLLAGIRHKNLNPDEPFVELRANFTIANRKQALEIFAQIKNRFNVFKPKHVQFFSAREIDCEIFGNLFLVGNVIDVNRYSHFEGKKLELRTLAPDDDYFKWYEKQYQLFSIDHPQLARTVTVNSESIMNESRTAGLMAMAYLEEQPIGLIAGESANFLGQKALYFNDIVISQKFRGQGLAKEMQRAFINMHRDNFELVFGTIDSANLASKNTALANNRKVVRYECFVKI